MIDFISMIATVTSTILQWLDYSQSREKSSSPVLESYNNEVGEQLLQIEIATIISALREKQETIDKALFIALIICLFGPIWLTNNVDFFIGDQTVSFFDTVLFIVSFALLAVLAYGILVGTARFLIQREINYYSFDKNDLSKLKLALANAKWKNSYVKWFLKEAMIGIKPSSKTHVR